MADITVIKPTLYVDEFDLSTMVDNLNAGVEFDGVGGPTGGDTSRIEVPGLGMYPFEFSGFLQDGVGKSGDILTARKAAEIIVTHTPASFADGGRAYFARGSGFDFGQQAETGQPQRFSFTGRPKESPGRVPGTVLGLKASRTSTGSGTARQVGSVAAGQSVYAAVHCFTVTGSTPTLDLIIESDDNSGMTSPVTRIAFTQLTAAGKEMKSAAGAITDDWWRATWTIGGGSPDFTFFVVMGIV